MILRTGNESSMTITSLLMLMSSFFLPHYDPHDYSVLGTPAFKQGRKERRPKAGHFETDAQTVKHPHGCTSVPLDKDTRRDMSCSRWLPSPLVKAGLLEP